MSEFFTPSSTPNKTPSTADTEIVSPYDYDKQVDFEFGEHKKRRRAQAELELERDALDEDLEATVITDRYNRPIFTKENGVLIEVTTKTENRGPYFYENGEPVDNSDIVKGTSLFEDFNRVKRSRTIGGKSRKSRKGRKSRKSRKTVKRRKNGKNRSAHKKKH